MTVCQPRWREIFFENEEKIWLILCWHKEYQANSRGRKKKWKSHQERNEIPWRIQLFCSKIKEWQFQVDTGIDFLKETLLNSLPKEAECKNGGKCVNEQKVQRNKKQKQKKSIDSLWTLRVSLPRFLSQSNLVLCLFNKKIYCFPCLWISFPLDANIETALV